MKRSSFLKSIFLAPFIALFGVKAVKANRLKYYPPSIHDVDTDDISPSGELVKPDFQQSKPVRSSTILMCDDAEEISFSGDPFGDYVAIQRTGPREASLYKNGQLIEKHIYGGNILTDNNGKDYLLFGAISDDGKACLIRRYL